MKIEHDAKGQRFVAHLESGDATLTYVPMGGALDVQHTVVPPAAQGQGIGDELARAAFDYAKANGKRIISSCPFVQHWLEEHPGDRALAGG